MKSASSEFAAEMGRRWRCIEAMMESDGYDALVVCGRGCLHEYGYLEYATAFYYPNAVAYALFVRDEQPVLLLGSEQQSTGADDRLALASIQLSFREPAFADPEPGLARLRSLVSTSARIGVVGLSDIAPSRHIEWFRRAIPTASLRDATDAFRRVKAKKSPYEFDRLREAAAIAELGFDALAQTFAETRDPRLAAAEARSTSCMAGARDALVLIGQGTYFPVRVSPGEMRDGALVTAFVEVAIASGYWVETGGLISMGHLSDPARRLAQSCQRTMDALIDNVSAGCTIEALVSTASALAPADVGVVVQMHGVGIDDHDLPLMRTQNADSVVGEGMAVAVHPRIWDRATNLGASMAATFEVMTHAVKPVTRLRHGVQILR